MRDARRRFEAGHDALCIALGHLDAAATATRERALSELAERVDVVSRERAARERTIRAEHEHRRLALLEMLADGVVAPSLAHEPWESPAWARATVPPADAVPVPVAVGDLGAAGVDEPIPVLVDVIGGRGLLLIHEDREAAQAVLDGLLLRAVATAPGGQLAFEVHDPERLGRSMSVLTSLRRHTSKLMPHTTTKDVRSLEEQLHRLTDHIERVTGQYLDHHNPSLRHVVASTGRAVEPFRTFVFTDLAADLRDEQSADIVRLVRQGPRAGVSTILLYPAGDQPRWVHELRQEMPTLVQDGQRWVFGGAESRVAVTVAPRPPARLTEAMGERLGPQIEQAVPATTTLSELLPDPARWWTSDATDELTTPIGTRGLDEVSITFDMQTINALIGGRAGSGKSNLLQILVHGLAVRYSPEELHLFLLDFKEGLEFAQCAPSSIDPSWLPHAQFVSVKSDRDVGLAALTHVADELQRRGDLFGAVGATNLAAYRARRADTDPSVPRIVVLIDEFQVLLSPTDAIANQAVQLLETIARKGRAYGIHLLLASQGLSGIDALWSKQESIFDQFKLRLCMETSASESTKILGRDNEAAGELRERGEVIVNRVAGATSGNERAQVAYASEDARGAVRLELWNRRPIGSRPPRVIVGEQYAASNGALRAWPPVGPRAAPVAASIRVDRLWHEMDFRSELGRHLAVLGEGDAAAQGTLQVVSVGAALRTPMAAFELVGQPTQELLALQTALEQIGARTTHRTTADFRAALPTLRDELALGGQPTYYVLFEGDQLGRLDEEVEDYTPLQGIFAGFLRDAPTRGRHVIGWWRSPSMLETQLGFDGDSLIAARALLQVDASFGGRVTGLYDFESKPYRLTFVDQPYPAVTGIPFGAVVDPRELSQAAAG